MRHVFYIVKQTRACVYVCVHASVSVCVQVCACVYVCVYVSVSVQPVTFSKQSRLYTCSCRASFVSQVLIGSSSLHTTSFTQGYLLSISRAVLLRRYNGHTASCYDQTMYSTTDLQHRFTVVSINNVKRQIMPEQGQNCSQ